MSNQQTSDVKPTYFNEAILLALEWANYVPLETVLATNGLIFQCGRPDEHNNVVIPFSLVLGFDYDVVVPRQLADKMQCFIDANAHFIFIDLEGCEKIEGTQIGRPFRHRDGRPFAVEECLAFAEQRNLPPPNIPSPPPCIPAAYISGMSEEDDESYHGFDIGLLVVDIWYRLETFICHLGREMLDRFEFLAKH